MSEISAPTDRLITLSPMRAPRPSRLVIEPRVLVSVLAPAGLVILWELAGRLALIDQRFFPAPSSIVGTFWYLTTELPWRQSLPMQVLISLGRVGVGFLIGAVPAVLIGTVMGLNPMVRAAIQPLIGALMPIPKVALLPFVMLVFGIGEESKWAIIAIGVFFQIVVATSAGVANIDRIYLDVGRNFRAGRLATYFTIALPGALPTILAGLRLGWGVALLLLVTAEMFSSKTGLGAMIWQAWQTLAVEDMYVGLVVIAALGTVSFWIFDAVERRLIPWKRP